MYPDDVRLFFLFLLPLLVSAVANLMSDAIVICFVCVYNKCCILYGLNCGIKLIIIVQARTVAIFMQEISNSFKFLHYEDANCTLQGFANDLDGLNHCKNIKISYSQIN